MANKPRMGSDPFQKKDPLSWIGGDQAEKADKQEGVPNPPSNRGKSSKSVKPNTQSQPSKAGNPSKHDLPSPPSPPSPPDNPGGPSGTTRGTSTSKGLRPGWTRATFIVREETVQQLKAVAYWDRKELKRVVEEAFQRYLQGKSVSPIPDEFNSGD